MLDRMLPAALLLGAALIPPPVAAEAMSFNSVRVELPAGDRMFPDGKGAEAAGNNCLACHSAGMVLNQPGMSRAAWEAEVNKMRATYKAPVAAEDVPAIVDYLAALRPPK